MFRKNDLVKITHCHIDSSLVGKVAFVAALYPDKRLTLHFIETWASPNFLFSYDDVQLLHVGHKIGDK